MAFSASPIGKALTIPSKIRPTVNGKKEPPEQPIYVNQQELGKVRKVLGGADRTKFGPPSFAPDGGDDGNGGDGYSNSGAPNTRSGNPSSSSVGAHTSAPGTNGGGSSQTSGSSNVGGGQNGPAGGGGQHTATGSENSAPGAGSATHDFNGFGDAFGSNHSGLSASENAVAGQLAASARENMYNGDVGKALSQGSDIANKAAPDAFKSLGLPSDRLPGMVGPTVPPTNVPAIEDPNRFTKIFDTDRILPQTTINNYAAYQQPPSKIAAMGYQDRMTANMVPDIPHMPGLPTPDQTVYKGMNLPGTNAGPTPPMGDASASAGTQMTGGAPQVSMSDQAQSAEMRTALANAFGVDTESGNVKPGTSYASVPSVAPAAAEAQRQVPASQQELGREDVPPTPNYNTTYDALASIMGQVPGLAASQQPSSSAIASPATQPSDAPFTNDQIAAAQPVTGTGFNLDGSIRTPYVPAALEHILHPAYNPQTAATQDSQVNSVDGKGTPPPPPPAPPPPTTPPVTTPPTHGGRHKKGPPVVTPPVVPPPVAIPVPPVYTPPVMPQGPDLTAFLQAMQ